MKKTIFLILALIFTLASNSATAINLDKIVGIVESATIQSDSTSSKKKSESPLAGIQNEVFGRFEAKINGVIQKIESKIEKFDKKFDEYEKKIDKAEKATDKVIATINNFDSSQVVKYVVIAKYVTIALISLFLLMIVLLIVVFVQLLRVNSLLRNRKN